MSRRITPSGSMEASPELNTALRSGPFDRALQLAIQSRGLSLERIHARLTERGIPVSVASLSYWQRGLCRPERARSLRAVRVLEEILDLEPDSLVTLIGPRRPRGRWLEHVPGSLTYEDVCVVHGGLSDLLDDIDNPVDGQLETLSHHETYLVGPRREELAARSRVVFRARRAGVDRYVAIHHNEERVAPIDVTSDLCRVGRVRSDPERGLTAAELIFDHPLAQGETYVIDYAFTNPGGGPPSMQWVRGFRFPTREYLLQVRFDEQALPARCYQIWQPNIETEPTDRRELRVSNWNSVHIFDFESRAGVHGIRWEWN
ncbi:hypothetical protein SAMN05421505_12731 [Sinosporangium album]|uniref:Uncharacterized protein n=1 Tax=Sinosporangium album TaxID=504805 RepID=A0A1G8GGG9_9ACTN|nr:hypothetical protein [Sinosporangium album]SDH93426.1 hypothetical protein SAMN05421505_12731 [Sinosporangium album]